MIEILRKDLRWCSLLAFALPAACSSSGEGGADNGAAGMAASSAGTSAAGGSASSAGGSAGGGASGSSGAAGPQNAGNNAGGASGAAAAGAGGVGNTQGGNASGGAMNGGNDSGGSAHAGSSNAGAGGSPSGGSGGMPATNSFTDSFDAFDTKIWSCEYACPEVSASAAHFTLLANNPPNTSATWSKIRYKPRRFTSGSFSVHFSLTKRLTQAVWWGIALWDDGPSADEYNEINFGYTTDESFPNTQLRFESTKRGKGVSLKVDVGADLYSGTEHVGMLEYDSTHVAFYFDGKLLQTITDTSVIPTDAMDFIIGPRLVDGSLTADFTETASQTDITW